MMSVLFAVDPGAGPFAEDPFVRDTLVRIWFLILGVLLAGYAILDGFDLGVGILHPFVPRSETDRRLAMNSIGPLWDGNEVWLVTFGGAMFAMFPYAYATFFSGFYTAFMLLLFMLIFRGVSMELRGKMESWFGRRAWDWSFFVGSLGATFLFGAAAGNVITGVPMNDRATITSGILDQLSPYAILTGATAVGVFAMHGAIYLCLKTEGALQERYYRAAWIAFGLFAAMFVVQSVWTLAEYPRATENFKHSAWLWLVPLANVAAIVNIPRSLAKRQPGMAFVSSCFNIFVYVFLLMAALYPNIVPSIEPGRGFDIHDAASSNKTLVIGLIVVAIGMPFVVTYTGVMYWTFRGKVKLESHSY